MQLFLLLRRDLHLWLPGMFLWSGLQLLALRLPNQLMQRGAAQHGSKAAHQPKDYIMKAVFCPRYGAPNVLEEREIEMPRVTDKDILVRSFATSLTVGDCRVRALKMPKGFGLIGRLALGFTKPRQPILGSELSGVVVAVGKDVTKFKIGDEVIVFTGTKLGCHVEFKAVSQDAGVIVKPANMSFEEGAAMAASGTTALSFLRRAKIEPGSKVLIVGAAGGVGSAAVMLAKEFGAEVTAVCSSSNIEFVASWGADRVIDYTTDDFTKSGETYDVILDASGTLSYKRARGLLKPKGKLLLVSATLPDILQAAFGAIGSGHKVLSGPAPWTKGDLEFLRQAVESGAYRVPVDRTFSLDQIADAHAFVDSGRKRGNVVVSLEPSHQGRNGDGISVNLPRMSAEGAIPNI